MNAPDPITVRIVFDADKFQADLRAAMMAAVGSVLTEIDKYLHAETDEQSNGR